MMDINKPLILATDLDGTFLEGSLEEKHYFYRLLQHYRDQIGLIFVTGRELDITLPLYEEELELPKADYIIADIGTTIIDGISYQPIQPIQDEIEQRWNNANEKVKQLLAQEPGIVLQPVITERRLSYYYKPALLQPSTLDKIVKAGYDYILSSDKYLDVMPKGVAKGATLLKLLDSMRCSHHSVVVCGDTLNDLSLFKTGLRGIAMGNSESKLLKALAVVDNVYISTYPGVMGILDGLRYYQVPFLATHKKWL